MSQCISLEVIDLDILDGVSGGEFQGKFFPRAFDSSRGIDASSGRNVYCETNAEDGGSRCELRGMATQQDFKSLGFTPEIAKQRNFSWPDK